MVNEIFVVNEGSSNVRCTLYCNTTSLEPLLDIHINSSSQHHRALQFHNYVTDGTGNLEIDYPKTSAIHLAADAIDRLPQLGSQGAYTQMYLQKMLVDHKKFICEHGEDMPEILNWSWK